MLFVTGGTGFVGSAVTARLVQEGHRVRAGVRDPSRADILPESVHRVPVDLADEESLVAAMDGCDGVFHLAASVGDSGAAGRTVNVDGTGRVLAAARRAGVRRLVHTSTSAAVLRADGVVAETGPGGTVLTDAYSVTKAEAEALVLAAAERGDVDAVVTNIVNVYGPSPRGPQSYNTLFAAAARGEVPAIVDVDVGWVLADDVAAGQLAAFRSGESGRRYVLCGEVASFPTVLDTYCELVGSPHRVRALPPGSDLDPDAPLYAQRSVVYGKFGGYRVADQQARRLGFAPRGIAAGLALTAEWLPTA